MTQTLLITWNIIVINTLKKSSLYTLNNSEPRNSEPNLSAFDKIIYNNYIAQIEFLLKAEGVNFIESEKRQSVKYYLPKSSRYQAQVYFQDGKFIVEQGSVVFKPKETR